MTSLRLRKTTILRKGWEFDQVYKGGKRLYGTGFILICRSNGTSLRRLGISVHRNIRGAVRRNRLKRIIRESFRLWHRQYPESADMVFAVRPDFSITCPEDIAKAVAFLVCQENCSREA